jgi:hypothetical protein
MGTTIFISLGYNLLEDKKVRDKSFYYVMMEYVLYVTPTLLANLMEATNCMVIDHQSQIYYDADQECSDAFPSATVFTISYAICTLYVFFLLGQYYLLSNLLYLLYIFLFRPIQPVCKFQSQRTHFVFRVSVLFS